MTLLFRQVDPRFPFLWELANQPAGRWNDRDEGPVQYLSDTPDGAWAEFLRRERISDATDLAGIERDLWAVEVPQLPAARPALPEAVLRGGVQSYPRCREEARRLRARTTDFVAPSAALHRGGAHGSQVRGGVLVDGAPRDGNVVVLFGARPGITGWRCCRRGRPDADLLGRVHHL